jgi:metallo-beta-lactamase family protein
MKLFFSGAAHEVTGSKHYLEAAGKHILIDCGMEQGKDIFVNQDIPIPASDVDYVFLTHAHIDHSGLLPLLYAQGFQGSIYATDATCSLCDIMLRDSAHIQEFEAEWRTVKENEPEARRSYLSIPAMMQQGYWSTLSPVPMIQLSKSVRGSGSAS